MDKTFLLALKGNLLTRRAVDHAVLRRIPSVGEVDTGYPDGYVIDIRTFIRLRKLVKYSICSTDTEYWNPDYDFDNDGQYTQSDLDTLMDLIINGGAI